MIPCRVLEPLPAPSTVAISLRSQAKPPRDTPTKTNPHLDQKPRISPSLLPCTCMVHEQWGSGTERAVEGKSGREVESERLSVRFLNVR